jgi:uncharacterized membrane protein
MDAIRLIAIAILFVICDIPWLYISSTWAQNMMKKIQGGRSISVRWEGVIPVYLALAYLVLQTTSRTQSFAVGLCTYAVYDYTNYSTFANYDPIFALADTVWGGIVFMIVREVAIYLHLF